MAYYLYQLPLRFGRFGKHAWDGLLFFREKENFKGASVLVRAHLFWWLGLLLRFMDCFAMGEIYDTMMDLAKFRETRPLRDWEIELGRSVYGDNIRWELVNVDERAYLGPKQKNFAYVTYHTINTWGPLNQSTLMHEFVHIWQYERYGAIYLAKALQAQYSEKKYDYGGLPALRQALAEGKRFEDFNFEQQGDIVGDYHRLRTGYRPLWGDARREDLAIYETLLRPIRENMGHIPNG